jgi:heptosyltransferase-3
MTSTKPRTYLIVCCRYIGDVLVTTPLALSIKTAQPDAEVDYLVFEGTEGILAKNPHVHTVHTIPNKKASIGKLFSLYRQYDVAIAAYPSDRTVVAAAIAGRYAVGLTNGWRREWWKHLLLDMHYVCYDRLHVVQNMLMPLRMLGIEPIPKVVVATDATGLQIVQDRIPVGRSYLVLHPYSRNSFKCWPAEAWGRLAALISTRLDCVPLFTVTNDVADKAYLDAILAHAPSGTAVLKHCNLNQLAAVIAAADAYVGSDTLVTHMASALGTPTIALYGASWTRYWAPWPDGCQEFSPFVQNKGVQQVGNVTVIQEEWKCVPCNKESCRISTRNRPECLDTTTPDQVLGEIQKHAIQTHSK